MEKEQDLKKLGRVLRHIAGAGRMAHGQPVAPDAARFCLAQFNKTLARVNELEPATAHVFPPLPEDATFHATRLAAHELIAFLEEDEAPRHHHEHGKRAHHHRGCRPRVFVGAFPLGGRCG